MIALHARWLAGFLVILGLSLAPPSAHSEAKDGLKQARKIYRQAENQTGDQQVATYIKACDLGLADGCAQAFYKSTRHDKPQRLTWDKLGALALRACELDAWEYCNDLSLAEAFSLDRTPELQAHRLGFFKAGCESGRTDACLWAGEQLSSGLYGAPDYDGATVFFRKACEGRETIGCRMADALSARDADMMHRFETWTTAKLGPENAAPPALSLERNSLINTLDFKSADAIDATARGLKANCDSGFSPDCVLFGELITARPAYQDLTDQTPQALYTSACDAGVGRGCRLLADGSADADRKDTLLHQACDLDWKECGPFAETLFARSDAAGDDRQAFSLAYETAVRDCAEIMRYQYKMVMCPRVESLVRKHPGLLSLGVADIGSTAVRIANRDRRLPYAAYQDCLRDETAVLAAGIESGEGDAAWTAFVHKCGGTWFQTGLRPMCEARKDLPAYHNFVCARLQENERFADAVSYDGWSVSPDVIETDFRSFFSTESYKTATNDGFLVQPMDYHGKVTTNVKDLGRKALFFGSSPEEAETRTAIGNTVFRLIATNGHLVVIAPLDGGLPEERSLPTVHTLMIMPKGVAPEDREDGRISVTRIVRSALADSRHAWDEAAGRWNVETATDFTPTFAQWHAIATGDVYAEFSEHTEETGASICCDGYTHLVPFDTGPLSTAIVKRTELAGLYSGSVTPDVATAMRRALTETEPVSWSPSCGTAPSVNPESARADYSHRVIPDVLNNVGSDFNGRVKWYRCQEAAYNQTADTARPYIAQSISLPPTDYRRWVAVLMSRHQSEHLLLLQREADALDRLSDEIDTLSADYSRDQSRIADEQREEARSGRSEADAFFDKIGPQRHLDCLSSASSFAAQQACLGDMYSGMGEVKTPGKSWDGASDTIGVQGPVLKSSLYEHSPEDVTPQVDSPRETPVPRRSPEPDVQNECPAGQYMGGCGCTPIGQKHVCR